MSADFFTSISSKLENAKSEMGISENSNSKAVEIIKVSPEEIGNWEYRDRQEFELGDIEGLAESIKLKGQAQPIVLAKRNDVFKSPKQPDAKYVVIAGYRRWLACKSKGIPVESIIKDLTLQQAIACLVSENEKEQVSDYSKGLFYRKLLEREAVTQKEVYEKLGVKKGVFSNYLSFAEVPNAVWEAVGDVSKVSARTSAEIKLICQKGGEYIDAVIAIAEEIANGIGALKIKKLVDAKLRNKSISGAKEARSTRVEFSKNVFIEERRDGFKVDVKGLDSIRKADLKQKIDAVLTEFIENEKEVDFV